MHTVTVTTKHARTIQLFPEPVLPRRRVSVRQVTPHYSLAGDIQLFKNAQRQHQQNILEALHMAFGGR